MSRMWRRQLPRRTATYPATRNAALSELSDAFTAGSLATTADCWGDPALKYTSHTRKPLTSVLSASAIASAAGRLTERKGANSIEPGVDCIGGKTPKGRPCRPPGAVYGETAGAAGRAKGSEHPPRPRVRQRRGVGGEALEVLVVLAVTAVRPAHAPVAVDQQELLAVDDVRPLRPGRHRADLQPGRRR